jgi:Transglutaminase-like superfamily
MQYIGMRVVSLSFRSVAQNAGAETSCMYAPPKIHLHKIPKGYRGTLKTVEHIIDLIKHGAKDFHVRQTAIDILLRRAVRPKDYLGEIKSLFEWVQHNVRYTKDTFRVEVLHSAKRMLELRAGDCDDMAILLGAMLEAIGHPVRLALTGPDPLKPALFSHIYLEVFHKGRWIPLDATMPYPMGWGPRTLVKKIIAMERRPDMMAEDMELQGIGAPVVVPDWLKGLIQAVRGEAIQPKDARVKSLWDLLRERQLLRQSPWLKAVLSQIWYRGLPARSRPHTTLRLKTWLRRWRILPTAGAAVDRPVAMRPLQPARPVAVRPVRIVRPVAVRPVRPASRQPMPQETAPR